MTRSKRVRKTRRSRRIQRRRRITRRARREISKQAGGDTPDLNTVVVERDGNDIDSVSTLKSVTTDDEPSA